MKDNRLKIKINRHGNPMPERHGMWYDVYTAEEIHLNTLEDAVIDLGISIKAPEGWYPIVASRSSAVRKFGVIIGNGIGIIEDTYCGDEDRLGLVAVAIRETTIPKGVRIAQFTLAKILPDFEFEDVESMGEPNRGGYGSTGHGNNNV